ncbi:hypothetical protein D3C81_1351870 [compost metagenome]
MIDADNEWIWMFDHVAARTFANALHSLIHQRTAYTCSTTFFLAEEDARAGYRPVDATGGGSPSLLAFCWFFEVGRFWPAERLTVASSDHVQPFAGGCGTEVTSLEFPVH